MGVNSEFFLIRALIRVLDDMSKAETTATLNQVPFEGDIATIEYLHLSWET